MEIIATARYVRIAPRKVRLVADAIRRMDAERARLVLSVMPKRAAQPMLKLLQSAIASAKHDFQLERTGLRVKHVAVDPGPMLKRQMPRAMGRAAMIRKRTSHIRLVLEGGDPLQSSATAPQRRGRTKRAGDAAAS